MTENFLPVMFITSGVNSCKQKFRLKGKELWEGRGAKGLFPTHGDCSEGLGSQSAKRDTAGNRNRKDHWIILTNSENG